MATSKVAPPQHSSEKALAKAWEVAGAILKRSVENEFHVSFIVLFYLPIVLTRVANKL